MRECLTSLPRSLMPLPQHFHLQKGGWWFSASSVPPQFCEGLTAQSHGKGSPLIWDRNCMKLFSCVGKIEFCTPGGRDESYFYGKRRGVGKDIKNRETRGKPGKENKGTPSESQDCRSCCHRSFGGAVGDSGLLALLLP